MVDVGKVVGTSSRQQKQLGTLELSILHVVGNPRTDNEVHVQIGDDTGQSPFTLVIANPSDYSSTAFIIGNRVVVAAGTNGERRVEAIYSGKIQVYAAPTEK